MVFDWGFGEGVGVGLRTIGVQSTRANTEMIFARIIVKIGMMIYNLRYLYFLTALFLVACNQGRKEQVSIVDMSENSLTLLQVDSFYIRLTEKEDGSDRNGYVQLLNQNLTLLDEMQCMAPYPILNMKNDTLVLKFYLSQTSRTLSMGNFSYYKEKFKKLGFLNLNYEISPIDGARELASYSFDSVSFEPKSQLSFYYLQKKLKTIDIRELHYSNEPKSFYIWVIKDGIKLVTLYKPKYPIEKESLYSLLLKCKPE